MPDVLSSRKAIPLHLTIIPVEVDMLLRLVIFLILILVTLPFVPVKVVRDAFVTDILVGLKDDADNPEKKPLLTYIGPVAPA